MDNFTNFAPTNAANLCAAEWARHGFSATLVARSAELTGGARLAAVPAWYTPEMVRYQALTIQRDWGAAEPLVLEVSFDRRPMALVAAVALPEKPGNAALNWALQSHTTDLLIPLIAEGESARIKRRFFCAWADVAARFALGNAQTTTLTITHYPTPSSAAHGFCSMAQHLLEAGASVATFADCYVDLQLPEAEATAAIRHGFRDMMRKAQALWQPRLWQGPSPDLAAAFAAFQALHLTEAGRMTRPQASWDAQQAAVAAGQAVLVTLAPIAPIASADETPLSSDIVGAALFDLSPTEALYSVGAYRRDLFAKPLGHLVQAAAMQHFRRSGLHGYRLGTRPFTGTHPEASEKEHSIGWFKAGFATHLLAGQRFTVSREALAAAAATSVVAKAES